MHESESYYFCRSLMAPDEHILWHGKPEPGTVLSSQDVFMIPFSLLWCGFAVFWTVGAAKAGGTFGLFGVPFLLMGLYMVFGRLVHAAYLRKNSYYVITNKRIYRQRGKKIDFLSSASMPPYQTIVHKNGCGTVYFQDMMAYGRYGRYSRYNSTHYATFNNGMFPGRGFTLDNLADIGRVQNAIEQMEP